MAQEALKKLEEQLNCPVCLDTYTDPKLLPCHHVYCQKCLLRLVFRDQQGQLVLTCPHCRQVTPVPPGGVAGLQAAFHINHLLDIQDSLQKLKVSPATVEGSVGSDSSSLNPVSKASHCYEHPDKELELYCETCEKLICFHCAIKGGSHHTHDQELLDKAYEKYSKEIISSFEPMEKQLATIGRALAQLDTHCGKITDQEASLEAKIHDTMRRLREILYTRETSLVDRLHQMTRDKLKKLAVQKDQLETTQAQLSSCLEFMKESLKTSNQEEVLKMKTTVVQQVKELTTTFQPSVLKPSTTANTVFSTSPDFSTECQNFGKLYSVSITVAIEEEDPCLLLEGLISPWGVAVNHKGEIIVSEEEGHCVSVFSSSGEKLRSFGSEGDEKGQFITPYGVAVDAEGNIFVIDCYNNRLQKFTADGEFLTAVGTEGSGPLQFEKPKDLAFNPNNGKLYIVEDNRRVQVLNSDLTFFDAFGCEGCLEGEFRYPCGITCDSTGDVYVVDSGNRRVQVFTAEGRYLRQFGSLGTEYGELNLPIGIAVDDGLVYVSDYLNHRISVFTCEGEFVMHIGEGGDGLGQFRYLANLAIVNGLLYVCDRQNHRVQVFTINNIRDGSSFGCIARANHY